VKACADCLHADSDGDALTCRRYPPTVIVLLHPVMRQPFPAAAFPQVTKTMVCGEWQEKPLASTLQVA
jgi:hypothetical protein